MTAGTVATFKEEGSGLTMNIGLWYVLGESGGVYRAAGFASAEEALSWARSPEGIAAGAGEAAVPAFRGPADGWGPLGTANVFFARDLYDFWNQLPPSHKGLGGLS